MKTKDFKFFLTSQKAGELVKFFKMYGGVMPAEDLVNKKSPSMYLGWKRFIFLDDYREDKAKPVYVVIKKTKSLHPKYNTSPKWYRWRIILKDSKFQPKNYHNPVFFRIRTGDAYWRRKIEIPEISAKFTTGSGLVVSESGWNEFREDEGWVTPADAIYPDPVIPGYGIVLTAIYRGGFRSFENCFILFPFIGKERELTFKESYCSYRGGSNYQKNMYINENKELVRQD